LYVLSHQWLTEVFAQTVLKIFDYSFFSALLI